MGSGDFIFVEGFRAVFVSFLHVMCTAPIVELGVQQQSPPGWEVPLRVKAGRKTGEAPDSFLEVTESFLKKVTS